ncbi:DUF512 domain-containing protein [Propionispora sp. 2/2-37]|uniref:DUF512 domain-containing protein n=1 Tax=Propionispora sp. 2/2-37 TaxID=1677858 RepID=UPI002100762F|nr:DUF512 domain-containing protein [Propionispora sp. 2/2-37]
MKDVSHKGVIARVIPCSIAAELELQSGDKLLSVNGQKIKDIIELSFALADESLELVIEKQDGEQEIIELEKDYDEELGIEFESAVFDGVRRCANRCIFCFVDQMPPGMRESLYVKDDDYRLSFLYGNFVTLTNVGSNDIKRIRNLHLSPLYVSVHATNGTVRQSMLNNRRAAQIMEQIHSLTETGIELHTQVVLCPGINDGQVLEQTIRELYALHPKILSLAIVPVGLSRYRDRCYPLGKFSPKEAQYIIDSIHTWQIKCRRECGSSFVYLADEFYLSGGREIPEYDVYDGFPQLENGIGLVRNFLQEWREAVREEKNGYLEPHCIDVVCGVSAKPILQSLCNEMKIKNLNVRLVAVNNNFFGPDITVTGLLTGKDIISELKSLTGPRTGVIIPGIALRKGENIFLDDSTPEDIVASLGVPVRIAHGAGELYNLLTAWR